MFFTFLKQVEPDGQCLMNAALPQFLHQKEFFNADLLQKQVALHMLKHDNLFLPLRSTRFIGQWRILRVILCEHL